MRARQVTDYVEPARNCTAAILMFCIKYGRVLTRANAILYKNIILVWARCCIVRSSVNRPLRNIQKRTNYPEGTSRYILIHFTDRSISIEKIGWFMGLSSKLAQSRRVFTLQVACILEANYYRFSNHISA